MYAHVPFASVKEKSMDSGTGGIHPNTIRTIRECLEKQFIDIKFSQNMRPTFGFRHGIEKQSWQVVFNEQFLVDHTSSDELQHFVAHKAIPKVLKNPGKRIQISKWGDIAVEERI
jgi:hypothetical protein